MVCNNPLSGSWLPRFAVGIEVFGRLGPSAASWLHRMAQAAAQDRGSEGE